MKKNRHNAILDIINSKPIETQEELQQCLKQAGYNVTQATVSRDIKELNLVKHKSGTTNRYVRSGSVSGSRSSSYSQIISHAITSVEQAMNTVVVKSHTGTAQAVAAAIDNMNLPEIIGTIAGDDTILIITKSEQNATAVEEKLNLLK